MSASKNKRNKDGASKRQKTLIKKAHELGTLPGIDVAVIICKRGRFYTYMSTDRGSWPPTKAEIKMSYPTPKTLSPCDFKKEDGQDDARRGGV